MPGRLLLAPEGFLFCCWTDVEKIEPRIFDICAKDAVWCEVDPARIRFADHIPKDRHLARQRLAGLFLDTASRNAHTTAVDALWVRVCHA